MEKNANHFFKKAKMDPQQLKKMLQTPDGQAAMELFSKEAQGSELQKAAQSASSGNTEEAVKLVSQYLKTPEGAALAERIQKAFHP